MRDSHLGNISFHHLDTPFRLRNRGHIRDWIQNVCDLEAKFPGKIAYYFCSDAYLLSINQSFLSHDTFTDIVTFDYSEAEVITGEIFISVDRLRENAKKYHSFFTEELHRVMIHGILHLCGYGDKTPAEQAEMTGKEDFCLSLRSF